QHLDARRRPERTTRRLRAALLRANADGQNGGAARVLRAAPLSPVRRVVVHDGRQSGRRWRMDRMVTRGNVVAIVPARGGSKSIPRKNMRPLGGVPLLSYSVEAGLSATLVDRVIVSTDDDEMASIAREWGAEVPFMRPASLAQDATLDLPVFEHA